MISGQEFSLKEESQQRKKRIMAMAGRAANKLITPLGLKIHRIHGEEPMKARSVGENILLYPDRRRPEKPKYLNIGSGSFYHPYWHNLDHLSEWYASYQQNKIDFDYDLLSRDPFPIAVGSLKVAYCCHVIEHIRDEDVKHLFQEVYRALDHDGIFRIVFPDMDLIHDAYRRRELEFFHYWQGRFDADGIEQKFLHTFATALTRNHPDMRCRKYTDEEVSSIFEQLEKRKALDFLCRQVPVKIQRDFPGDHMNWFDEEKLREMLSEAGFSRIWNSKYAQSRSPLLRDMQLFDQTSPQYSGYIECMR